MSVALFEKTTMQYGDKEQYPAARVVCDLCGAVGKVPFNWARDYTHIDHMLKEKFESKGWKIGTARKHHRCPQCVDKNKWLRWHHASKKEKEVLNGGQAQNQPSLPRSESPRSLSPEDRRVIFLKLSEAYGGETNSGYLAGWTDQKVASDLGVPLAWVKEIREQNFGEVASNPEIEKLLAEAAELKAEISKLAAIGSNLKEQWTIFTTNAQRLVSRHEMLDKRLHNVQHLLKR